MIARLSVPLPVIHNKGHKIMFLNLPVNHGATRKILCTFGPKKLKPIPPRVLLSVHTRGKLRNGFRSAIENCLVGTC